MCTGSPVLSSRSRHPQAGTDYRMGHGVSLKS
jgi:hypothetical protein